MIQHGLKPIVFDHRDHSFVRTFGSIDPTQFPDEYNCDAGLTMPDQNADGHPNGCTGYAQSELCNDEDLVVYDPNFTYQKTLFMEQAPDGSACDIRDSLKSTIIYGVQVEGDTDVTHSYLHRRGQYFAVVDESALDSFDDIRSALWTQRMNRRSVSTGSPWLWMPQSVGVDGIIPETDLSIFTHKDLWGRTMANDGLAWHNYKVCGWKTINGQPYLIAKSWQGKDFGNGGYCYFSRTLINGLLNIEQTGAYTLAQASPDNIGNIQHTFLEFLLSYLRNVVGLSI